MKTRWTGKSRKMAPWELKAMEDRKNGVKPLTQAETDRRYVAQQIAHCRVYAAIYAAKGDTARSLARQQEEVDVIRNAKNFGKTMPTETDIQAAMDALQAERKRAQEEEEAERNA